MKVNKLILPILIPKLVAMATSIEPSEKGKQIINLRSSAYHTVKKGSADPEITG